MANWGSRPRAMIQRVSQRCQPTSDSAASCRSSIVAAAGVVGVVVVQLPLSPVRDHSEDAQVWVGQEPPAPG